jgi:hypothetical protein
MHQRTRLLLLTLALVALAGVLHAQVTAQAKRRIQQEEAEAFWKECGEVWWDGLDRLTFLQRRLLFKNFEAHRPLTRKEKDCILRASDRFLNGTFGAQWFGDMGHAYCIAPLLAVLRDENADKNVRMYCVGALSHIADNRVVDPLIDALTDDDANVAGHAWHQLHKILRLGPYSSFAPDPFAKPDPDLPKEWRGDLPSRKQTAAKLRTWWKETRKNLVLFDGAPEMVAVDRAASYEISGPF